MSSESESESDEDEKFHEPEAGAAAAVGDVTETGLSPAVGAVGSMVIDAELASKSASIRRRMLGTGRLT